MRADGKDAEAFGVLGFAAETDFRVFDSPEGVTIQWFSVDPMPSEAEIDAVDMTPAAVAARKVLADHAAAVLEVDRRIQKAGWLVTMEENNRQANRMNDIMAAIAAATSLANLQVRMAAVGNHPIYVEADVRDAIINKIQSGAAD